MKEENIAKFLGVLHRQGQVYAGTVFKDLNLSAPEVIVLMNLYEKGEMTQESLVNLLYVDKAMITRNIQSLEKKGFLSRRTSGEDKRLKILHLEENAIANKELITERMHSWLEYLTEGLGEPAKVLIFKSIKRMAEKSVQFTIDEGGQITMNGGN